MRLVDYLDKGASLGPDAPCLTTDGADADVRRGAGAEPPRRGRAGRGTGVAPGDKVAILSANDPVAFTCVFGISRAGAVWCPINPRNEAAENRELLDLFDCAALIFQASLRAAGRADPRRPAAADHPGLPRRRRSTARCRWEEFLGRGADRRVDRATPSTTSP